MILGKLMIFLEDFLDMARNVYIQDVFQTSSMKSRPTLILSAVVAALGGFLFGFDTAVISGTTHWLEDFFQLSKATLGFTVASAIIGTVAGSLIVGKPADFIGRRNVLYILALLYLLSALGSAMANNWTMFLIYRFLGGIAVGGSSVVAPMYIAEITPARLRGRMVAIVQANVVTGMLIAYLSNYFIASLELGQVEWRWMFGVEAIPAFLFFVLLFFIPLSPRWLVAKGREQEAAVVLEKCGTDNGSVEEEISEIRASLDMESDHGKEWFFSVKYMKPILLAMAIAVFNQLSGINAVLYYAPHIFRMAGAGSNSALLQSVAIGGTFVVFTMLALTIIDRFGRKKLMIIGSLGYIISLAVTAWAFYTYGTEFSQAGGKVVLISILIFVASHSFGQGTVIWVFISEVFPNRVRAKGQALGSFTHWFMAAAISWTFPIIADISGGHAFAFYTICMVGQLIWVIFVMPETKGLSLEEIQKKMGIK
jgi:SP family xylose:H+ symportor-like MFS transporter